MSRRTLDMITFVMFCGDRNIVQDRGGKKTNTSSSILSRLETLLSGYGRC